MFKFVTTTILTSLLSFIPAYAEVADKTNSAIIIHQENPNKSGNSSINITPNSISISGGASSDSLSILQNLGADEEEEKDQEISIKQGESSVSVKNNNIAPEVTIIQK